MNPLGIIGEKEKKAEKAAIETTAIISILKETPRKLEVESNTNELTYSLHLSFVGATILPPFLPCLKDTATKKRRDGILKKLEIVSDMYIKAFRDLRLDPEEGKRIKNEVEQIGEDIAAYLPCFVHILNSIARMDVKNIIIHTDDFAIPWTWAYYSREPFLPEDHAKDFLCNRYPCGTLIVDTQEECLNRLWKFWEDVKNKSTDEELLSQFEVSLFQGNLSELNKGAKRERGQYLKNLQEILNKRFDKKNISLFTSEDWKPYSGNSDKFAARFLWTNINTAKIIHYLGHVHQGALKFDEKTLTYPNVLRKRIHHFEQNPLVVLHGCSSGIIVDLSEKDKQLPTVFLEKGASGCVVALLPVSLPLCQKMESETLIDIFYRKVVVDMMPYGKALYEARRQFQHQEKTKHDPQWLFFHLYGDPRAMLITTSEKVHLRRLEYFWANLEKKEQEESLKRAMKNVGKNEARIGLFYNEDSFDIDGLIEELENDEYMKSIKVESPYITLGPDGVIELMGIGFALKVLEIVVEQIASPVIDQILKKIKNKLKLKNKNLREVKKVEKKLKDKNKGKMLKFFEIVDENMSKDSLKNEI